MCIHRPPRYIPYDFEPDEIPPQYYFMTPRPRCIQPLTPEQLNYAEYLANNLNHPPPGMPRPRRVKKYYSAFRDAYPEIQMKDDYEFMWQFHESMKIAHPEQAWWRPEAWWTPQWRERQRWWERKFPDSPEGRGEVRRRSDGVTNTEGPERLGGRSEGSRDTSGANTRGRHRSKDESKMRRK
ncbi:MAG: hypothetical protein M1812_001560 [Candelaria pacifica]|nr:MAG: hypothetical protein M1812_001560 [Candelaria pacifica]